MLDAAKLVRPLLLVFLVFWSQCPAVEPAISQTLDRYQEDVSVIKLAREQELDQLNRLIGRYVTGRADVYVGELQASQSGTDLDALQLPTGPVVGALTRKFSSDSNERDTSSLIIVGLADGFWLRVTQNPAEPNVTFLTLIRPPRANAGVVGSCRQCFPNLRQRPAYISLPRIMAVGNLHDQRNSTFRIQLTGHLKRLPPSALRLEQLEVLNPGIDSYLHDETEAFERVASEGVRNVERHIRQRVPPTTGAPPQTRCERDTRYTAERFVDLADLSQFGVRKITILGQRVCCLDHDSHGGSEECTKERAQ
jgi:hypothetical protein